MALTCLMVFFFNDTATTEIYTLSLHDALPIFFAHQRPDQILRIAKRLATTLESAPTCRLDFDRCPLDVRTFPAEVRFVRSQVATRRGGFSPVEATAAVLRSEEHTAELQSRQYLVCRLLLEKKNPITSIYSI